MMIVVNPMALTIPSLATVMKLGRPARGRSVWRLSIPSSAMDGLLLMAIPLAAVLLWG
ncbi:hypothetical protein ACWT_1349 [Actinoplanes sp. SE50]|nr:hypothetical protein ACPL_1470 [Actinoplanes sp. SE50/110]ATO80764.1 hypothetical protein ACWT_1349 [Actinoplanes sp. SE50]SLL98172.1 hypothetical protein ACSP50_1396 [Actinoplanes sp. SE50/110]